MKHLFFIAVFLMGCFITNAQWNNDPAENNRITPLGAEIYNFDMGASKDGATYISYLRPMGDIASVLQIIDKDGNMLFSEGGLIVSHEKSLSWTAAGDLMFIDRDDNAIIAVTDCRYSTGEYDEVSYSLYKVSPSGEMLWGEKGLDLDNGVSFNLVHSMKIVQLEDGSYVCAWGITNESDRTYIQLQRISESGEFLWEPEEARLYDSQISFEWPYLTNAGNNQVILVYTRGAGRTVMARKIDFDASKVWAEDVTIYSGGFTIPPVWVIIRVIPDQMGGAFVGWYDDRNWENKESTYIAHVTTDGTLGFDSEEGGVKIGHNEVLRGFAPEMYFNKDEMALYAAFRETSAQQQWQQMTGQKLEIPSGKLVWDEKGLEIAPLKQQSISDYSIQGGENDNVAIFFGANEDGWGKDVLNAMLINGKGDYVWKDEIIPFSTFPASKGRLASTSLINNNFWVTAWNDSRIVEGDPSGSAKIYVQRINLDGTLGDNETSIQWYPKTDISFMVVPTIVNGMAEILVNSERTSKADISLYSIMGQKIETIYSGMLQTGNNAISWNAQKSSLSKGVYFVTLTCDAGRKSLRIIIN